MAEVIAGSLLVLLAVAHSLLGESDIVKPLFRQPWDLGFPRRAAERILRFAWHLLSIAWIGMALIAFGVDSLVAIAVVAATSAVLIGVLVPAHFAWPVGLVIAWAALTATDAVPRWGLVAMIATTALAATVLAAIHLYWTLGGRRWLEDAVPSTGEDAQPAIPPRWAAGVVTLALLVFSGLLVGAIAVTDNRFTQVAAILAALILAMRAIGDRRYVGFTKTVRSTRFAKRDDQIYTPTAALMALGAFAVVLL